MDALDLRVEESMGPILANDNTIRTSDLLDKSLYYKSVHGKISRLI